MDRIDLETPIIPSFFVIVYTIKFKVYVLYSKLIIIEIFSYL